MINVSSYTGYYNGHYLRSSYEYIYAKILEIQNIDYKVEEMTFTLQDGSSYKPDFFIYNSANILVRIVEIKSENKNRFIEALRKIDLLKKQIEIPIEILQSKQLKELCILNGLDFEELRNEWKKSKNTSKNHILIGEYNPMYGHEHKNESKIKNGIKTKLRFLDDEFRAKHSNAVKLAMEHVDKSKLGHWKEREIRTCEYCGKSFEVIYTSKQRFCSNDCGSRGMFLYASKLKREKNIEKYSQIKQDVIDFAISNQDLINSVPLNKVSTILRPYFEKILSRYNLMDDRNIFFAFYNEYNNAYKRLIKDLRIIINN